MMARSRFQSGHFTGASLAGWLFADLALLLAFAFLGSSVQGAVTIPTPTTTSVAAPGVRPTPIEVRVKMAETSNQLIVRINTSLSTLETVEEQGKSFLVVLIYVGTKGGSRFDAQLEARKAADTLERHWSRVVPGRTYFVPAVDFAQPVGVLTLKLFPVQT